MHKYSLMQHNLRKNIADLKVNSDNLDKQSILATEDQSYLSYILFLCTFRPKFYVSHCIIPYTVLLPGTASAK